VGHYPCYRSAVVECRGSRSKLELEKQYAFERLRLAEMDECKEVEEQMREASMAICPANLLQPLSRLPLNGTCMPLLLAEPGLAPTLNGLL
jgi:hypothetical protein